ncbi:MAG: hypothetical protein JWP81_1174 [Ferruginibacter sp.]|nr:hypothetical protein [Ferruginibacter sp.]
MNVKKDKYNELLKNIGLTLHKARTNAIKAVNVELLKANWEIGRHIIELEQHGEERAEYGSNLLARLSKDLRAYYGKGFGRRNLLDMRRFYLIFPKWQTVSAKLSWSHYVLLISISENPARLFYLKQVLNENLSVRELQRQIDSALFERLALSKDKKGVLKLLEKGNVVSNSTEAIKDPYVLDFLKIPQSNKVTEKDFEQKIIDNLQMFLLELGKGFAFISR